MYKVLLADDENIVIEALTYIIEGNFPGLCDLREARSGRTFIEVAEQFRPDICFVDIQMPGINGIDAMREVRAHNPGAFFIIVSAFNEFDYAKEAIGLGVLDYLNKPIEKEEIIRVLKDAMDKVDASRLRRQKELQTQEKLEIVTPIIESGFLYQLTNDYSSEETLESYKTLLNIEEDYGNFMVVQFGDEVSHGELTNAIGVSVRLEHAADQIKKMIAGHFTGYTGAFMGNAIATYLPCKGNPEDEGVVREERETQLTKAQALSGELMKALKVRLRIAFGTIHPLTEASASYKEALRAFGYREDDVVYARKSDNATDVITRAKSYMEAHYAHDISLEEVSEQVHMSPYYFSKLFKKRTNAGFVEYLTLLRVNKAKELLEAGDKSVKEVGILVGYPDQNYFSRIFKKQTGKSPSDYRGVREDE